MRRQKFFVRRDFSDSAYWNARVRTDADGKAKFDAIRAAVTPLRTLEQSLASDERPRLQERLAYVLMAFRSHRAAQILQRLATTGTDQAPLKIIAQRYAPMPMTIKCTSTRPTREQLATSFAKASERAIAAPWIT